ncbi:hypothetical protein FRB95_002148 [Tulasnella sp. JGI-2019a]|nr:hypothetical protein FRB95_002148 [Tulasnella sp. JGI-2019a]
MVAIPPPNSLFQLLQVPNIYSPNLELPSPLPMSAIKHVFRRFTNGVSDGVNDGHKKAKAVGLKAGHMINGGRSLNDRDYNDAGEPISKNQRKKQQKEDEKRERRQAQDEAERELQRRRQEEDEKARQEETPEQRAIYGMLPINQSQDWPHEKRWDVSTISAKDIGQEVLFRARIHTHRVTGSKLVFFVFRQQLATVQGVLSNGDGLHTEHMVRWSGRINVGSIVLVKGTAQKPLEEVKSASVHDAEVKIRSIHAISEVHDTPPFDVYDEEKAILDGHTGVDSDEEDAHLKVSMRTRFDNRIIDLRTPTSQAIFRVTSTICNIFRTYLDSQRFVEIHTPKLQGGATESGASVFQVSYFGREAFLAQSPQLAKQMCVSADFEKVYEIGPVFRAENSNTHRHLTEYTGLDLEMAFEEHYHEVLHVIDDTLKAIFKGVYERHEREVEVVKRQFPSDNLVWLEETPIIPFKDGIKLLKDSGWEDCDENDDLNTKSEIRLGELVKEKYKTDYYILDKFTSSARPFYTMLDPSDPSYTNSFDIFVRGQEILSGGQRIHNVEMLEKRMMELGVRPDSMEEYMEGFRWGAPPHAGGGIGLERLVMLILKLGDIRYASLFPRDPKSLPAKDVGEELRHPEASTLHPTWEKHRDCAQGEDELQPLEKLIANYGDATNTAWLDERYKVWRHEQTGAAVGYVPQDGFAIILGDPLCDKSQYGKVMQAFLRYIKKETKLNPLWLLVGECAEEILGGKLGWRTLTCVVEARVDPSMDPGEQDRNVDRKIRHAQKEGIVITDIPPGTVVPDDIREECNQPMKEWLDNRKGKQVHLTELNPFVDPEHRLYFIARDKENKIVALVAMAQLSPKNGYQAKYALDFPSAPNGTIELILAHALKAVNEAGAKSVTFGGTASDSLQAGHNLGGLRTKVLAYSYASISSALKLTQKSEFREKLGAQADPIYLCYPKNGMGPRAVKAIMNFFGEGEN